MPGRVKLFDCGHRGKGKYCHRCLQEKQQRSEKERAKEKWKKKLRAAPLNFGHVPPKVAKKTLKILKEIENGVPYNNLKGKRMLTIGQREIISIPVGREYRLICRDSPGKLDCIELITHETYNSRLNSGGWIG